MGFVVEGMLGPTCQLPLLQLPHGLRGTWAPPLFWLVASACLCPWLASCFFRSWWGLHSSPERWHTSLPSLGDCFLSPELTSWGCWAGNVPVPGAASSRDEWGSSFSFGATAGPGAIAIGASIPWVGRGLSTWLGMVRPFFLVLVRILLCLDAGKDRKSSTDGGVNS